jgi:multisubunit Na+/H+ antiporter MnhG subunit
MTFGAFICLFGLILIVWPNQIVHCALVTLFLMVAVKKS